MEQSALIEILYSALHSPLGLVVTVSDVKLAQQNFYKARKAAMDPELDILKIRVSPFLPEEELWITNGKERNRAPDGASDQPVSGGLPKANGAVRGEGLSLEDHSSPGETDPSSD